jgi:hypothetical protein
VNTTVSAKTEEAAPKTQTSSKKEAQKSEEIPF